MGMPEQEIAVTGTVREERDGRLVVDTEAAQGDNQLAAGRKDTENETSETKNTPRPSADGAFKPG